MFDMEGGSSGESRFKYIYPTVYIITDLSIQPSVFVISQFISPVFLGLAFRTLDQAPYERSPILKHH